MTQKPPPPIINIAVFRRDVYFLAALLLADKQIARLDQVKDAAKEHFDGEVNRLLVLVSVSARHLMDIQAESAQIAGETAAAVCGEYWENYPKSKSLPLHFRKACNGVIHAEEIAPYAVHKPAASGKSGRVFYTDRIVVRSKKDGKNARAELNGEKFAKYCIMLSNNFMEK